MLVFVAPLLLLTSPCLGNCDCSHPALVPIQSQALWEQFGCLIRGSNADPTSLPAGAFGRRLCLGDPSFSLLLLVIGDRPAPQLQLFLSSFSRRAKYPDPVCHTARPTPRPTQKRCKSVPPRLGAPSSRASFLF